MTKPNYQKAKFLLSVAKLTQLPPDEGTEVAFVGRSNAGKSSVLNRLTQNNQLARVSKTPGRTQHINLFALDSKRRIADLPGYGYAKVPPAMKLHWQKLLETYLQTRICLKGVIVIMDIRHPLKETDQYLLHWANTAGLSTHILLNKSDKLSQSEIKKTEKILKEYIEDLETPVTFQVFSALKGKGTKELQKVLDEWFTQTV